MRSLERALQLFEGLQRVDGPQRLSDIAAAHQLSSATALRILRVLKDHGLVTQVPGGYRVGSATLPPAQRFLQGDPLAILGLPVLDELARTTGLTASLYSRVGDERILIVRSDGQHPLRYTLPFGVRLPLTKGAAGKALIQHLDADALSQVLRSAIEFGYESADTSVEDVLSRLRATEGYAASADEREIGVTSVAVVVPRRDGGPSEAISLTGPAEGAPLDRLVALVPELRRACLLLGGRLEGQLY